MRMFLVGMCDIFLLLYLTALAEVDARRVSELTVHDYLALKRSEEDLKKTEAAQDRAIADAARELEEARAKLTALEARVKNVSSEKSELEARAREAAERAERTAREEEMARARLDRARLAQDELSKKLADEAARSQAALKEKETLAKTLSERDAVLSETEKQAEELAAKLKAQEEAAAAERAKAEAAAREAALARAAADQAAERERAAVAHAREAAAARTKALSYAESALETAENAAERASMASARAEAAHRRGAEASARAQIASRSGSDVYRTTIEGAIVTARITVPSSSILGASMENRDFRTVPVRVGRDAVVFVPLEQLGSSAELREVRATLGGAPVTTALVSPFEPKLVALIADRGVSPVGPSAAAEIHALTPSLIAVRNGLGLRFSDRMREIDAKSFVLQRDRLRAEGPEVWRYEMRGFRGTGDFGERLVAGDQIFDLEGKFVGIASTENMIRRIPSLAGWRAVMLSRR